MVFIDTPEAKSLAAELRGKRLISDLFFFLSLTDRYSLSLNYKAYFLFCLVIFKSNFLYYDLQNCITLIMFVLPLLSYLTNQNL